MTADINCGGAGMHVVYHFIHMIPAWDLSRPPQPLQAALHPEGETAAQKASAESFPEGRFVEETSYQPTSADAPCSLCRMHVHRRLFSASATEVGDNTSRDKK